MCLATGVTDVLRTFPAALPAGPGQMAFFCVTNGELHADQAALASCPMAIAAALVQQNCTPADCALLLTAGPLTSCHYWLQAN